MRTPRRRTTALMAAAVIALGLTASSEVRGTRPTESGPVGAPSGSLSGDRSQASCSTRIHGSHVVASCHNPYPEGDRLRLHIECARWWDVDADSAPADISPAGHLQLSGRCWKEIRSVWVGHEPLRRARPGN